MRLERWVVSVLGCVGMNALKWLAHRETTLAQREKGAKEDLYKYYKCIDFPRSLSPSTTSYSQHQL